MRPRVDHSFNEYPLSPARLAMSEEEERKPLSQSTAPGTCLAGGWDEDKRRTISFPTLPRMRWPFAHYR